MRRAFLFVTLLLSLAAAAGPAAAQGDSMRVRGYDAELVVNRDGTVDVTERLRIAFFGAWNGLNRDLSLEHRTGQGRRERLKVEWRPPTDGDGRELRHEMESEDVWLARQKIWIPGAVDAERTVVIRYRVRNGLRFFFEGSETGAMDELYWNVTGNDWTMPIDRVRAHVVLPAGVQPRQWSVYTGVEGSTASEADVTTDGNTLVFTSRRPLAPGEGLTVGVGWPPGAILSRPTEAQVRRKAALMRWPLALPLLAFFLSFRAWRRRGRDPRKHPIVVGYEPPEGMSPAELGTLVDHTVHMHDVTATLVDLAVRGYVGIEERTEKKLLGLISDTDYVFHLRRPRDDWAQLAEHERGFLDALFSMAGTATAPWEVIKAVFAEARKAHEAGEEVDADALRERFGRESTVEAQSVKLSDLQNRFYRSIPGIRDDIYKALMRRGYYHHRPDKVKGNWIGVGIAIGVLTVFAAVFSGGFGMGFVDPAALAIGGIGSGLLVIGFGIAMPARTEAGARAREAALGFREFLERVESDRYRRMVTSPEMFERYLPHAMAFEVEDRWARAFDDLFREPPDWYSGGYYGDGFRASTFSSRMSSLSSAAGSTMSSSPSSSGSGGGGSSGGGSGGGGGSGF